MNQLQMTWPKITTVIYPGQTLRVNTGWSNSNMPDNMTITTIPHKSLVETNLVSIPQILDSSNQG